MSGSENVEEAFKEQQNPKTRRNRAVRRFESTDDEINSKRRKIEKVIRNIKKENCGTNKSFSNHATSLHELPQLLTTPPKTSNSNFPSGIQNQTETVNESFEKGKRKTCLNVIMYKNILFLSF